MKKQRAKDSKQSTQASGEREPLNIVKQDKVDILPNITLPAFPERHRWELQINKTKRDIERVLDSLGAGIIKWFNEKSPGQLEELAERKSPPDKKQSLFNRIFKKKGG